MRAPAPWIRALALCAALLTVGCSRLVDSFVYDPDRDPGGTPGVVGLAYEEVRFESADRTELHGWWIPGSRPGPCLIFFHGTSGNISDRVDIVRRFHDRLGLGVFLFDYRGYGQSSGTPSELGLVGDAQGARALARARGWDSRGAILFGRNLGAAVAIRSAAESAPLALVVESSFTSVADLARARYPILSQLAIPWLANLHDSLAAVQRLRCPVLFLHGDDDRISPIGMGWRLFDAAADPKWFRTIPGAGHDDLAFIGGEPYWRAWEDLLTRVGAGDGG